MKLIKVCALSLLAVVSHTQAKINLAVAVMRNGGINIASARSIEINRTSMEVYRDDTTYIEAELMSEKDSMPLVRFIIATKNETGSFVVRGTPQLSTSIANGLGMATLQCDGRGESFTLVMAVSKAE